MEIKGFKTKDGSVHHYDYNSLANKPDSGQNVNAVEPAYEDRPKFFFGAPLQQTKDEIVTTLSYRSKTLSFDCYAKIKAQGNSTMGWPKKNQSIKLYEDAECTKKFKVNFKGWGEQSKFVLKAYWRDLTHVRDVVSVRLEGDCMKSNPDYNDFPELLKNSPNMGGIDGFPVVVYAAGVYQGRYMCNIPKDAWMANMDDELDEHCILCSEGYGSSCFRSIANIDGSEWTDEVHKNVPASIQARWKEVIGFVMNSTDEEFVANLDSYIKVSTLIDRHIMGLLSCDFDGYGKNQLYITYDGQQWYANRYDKDGTWGNFWSGDNMLPSDYRRDQYEDYVNCGGNLLFIRLEQLFWKRLQDRWNYLKVHELSIPNILNRFRELYDITPPYVIEEDYAATTANGAFTGIPNKGSCTIQQIEKFAVERHAWTDNYIAGLTPVIPVPCTGITLSAAELTFDGRGSQVITATVTPENTTDSVVWSSNDTSVATVSGGTVTAKGNGSCIITATCGDHSATCTVNVSGVDEDTSLLYKLDGTKVMNGTSDYIDTGIKPYVENTDLTILVDFQNSIQSGTETWKQIVGGSVDDATQMLVNACMHDGTEASGFVKFRYYLEERILNDENGNPLTMASRERIRIAMMRRASDNTIVYAYSVDGTVCYHSATAGDVLPYTFKSGEQSVILGARVDAYGNAQQFWTGTLYNAEIYNRVLDDDEVTAFLTEPVQDLGPTDSKYQFANGTFTGDREIACIVSNGNHVRFPELSTSVNNGIHGIDDTGVHVWTEAKDSEWFIIPSGSTIELKLNNMNVAAGDDLFRYNIATVSGSNPEWLTWSEEYGDNWMSKKQTSTADYYVKWVTIDISGYFGSTTLEFDVELTVNGERWI